MELKVMRKFFIVIPLFLLATKSYAIFGIEKILPDLNLFKQEIKGDINGVKVQDAKLSSEITGLRLQVKELKISLEANLSAVAGVNNSIQKMSAGRDLNSGNSNDKEIYLAQTKLFQYQIKSAKAEAYKLYGIIILLINALIWIMKKQANDASSARWFQVELAKKSENGDFEQIMIKKREHDKQRSLVGNIQRILKKKEGING